MTFLKFLFREILVFLFLATLIVIPFRLFIAQPFVVQGASMEPTYMDSEYLIIDQLTYKFNEPKRGDVITFRYPKDPSVFFIKRIVGLPGETVVVDDETVTITTPGVGTIQLVEPYAKFDGPLFGRQSLTLGVDEYYVLGDNRPRSADSRVWGVLPKENIMGRAFLRLLPITNIDYLPGI
ncbi:signal peptidase I [Candidatus Wolfebacteria bacterium]|nr:signal peptidase I [Candidatus Wolfebacteria bacterium]